MQYSDDPKRRALAVTSYCDDSGTHEASQFSVIGGPLMNRALFEKFEDKWGGILHRYNIEPPFHMTDFVHPHGKYCAMYSEMKIALFREVADAINRHKIYSLSVAVPQKEFKQIVSMEVYRKLIGPYAVAFLVSAVLNHCCAERVAYGEQIAYVIDRGSSFRSQLDEAHMLIGHWEKSGKSLHTGSMTFADDATNAALQASDAVAWTARRALDDDPLPKEFTPLRSLFTPYVLKNKKKTQHFPIVVTQTFMQTLGNAINDWLASNTKSFPALRSLLKYSN